MLHSSQNVNNNSNEMFREVFRLCEKFRYFFFSFRIKGIIRVQFKKIGRSYLDIFEDIKQQIKSSQNKAILNANKEMKKGAFYE